MKRFAVIGLGNFGFYAVKALYEDGNEVVAIDTDKARVQAIDPYSTEAVVLATKTVKVSFYSLHKFGSSLFVTFHFEPNEMLRVIGN